MYFTGAEVADRAHFAIKRLAESWPKPREPEMAKTTPEITEAATKIRSNIIDAVFEKCWTEFIRNCDELNWSRSKIVGEDTKNNMLAAVRAYWLGQYLPTRRFFL